MWVCGCEGERFTCFGFRYCWPRTRDLASVNAGVRVVRRVDCQDGNEFMGARCGTMRNTGTGFSGSVASWKGISRGVRVMTCDGWREKQRREGPHVPQNAVICGPLLPARVTLCEYYVTSPPPPPPLKPPPKKSNSPISQPTNGRRRERSRKNGRRPHKETHVHAYSSAYSLRERVCAGAPCHSHGRGADNCAGGLHSGAYAAMCAELTAVRHRDRVRVWGTAACTRRYV